MRTNSGYCFPMRSKSNYSVLSNNNAAMILIPENPNCADGLAASLEQGPFVPRVLWDVLSKWGCAPCAALREGIKEGCIYIKPLHTSYHLTIPSVLQIPTANVVGPAGFTMISTTHVFCICKHCDLQIFLQFCLIDLLHCGF